jgi:hypothetical protein
MYSTRAKILKRSDGVRQSCSYLRICLSCGVKQTTSTYGTGTCDFLYLTCICNIAMSSNKHCGTYGGVRGTYGGVRVLRTP